MLKYCAVLSLCAGLCQPQSFITGQAARAVIGQTTFTSQTFGASTTAIGSVGGVAVGNNTIILADSNRIGLAPVNNRVLIFPLSQVPDPIAPLPLFVARCEVCVGSASNVLGQPNFTTITPATTQNGMNTPIGVATDGIHFAVADTNNNRVLLWNTFPTTLDQPADLVLGQPDFVTIQPVVVTASSFRAPQGVWFQNGKFFVADTQNGRVLIWNTIPTKNNQSADLVLGQPNFTTVPNFDQTKSSLSAAANSMLSPTSVTSDGTHLIVSDLGFSRVLIWNSIPTTNDQAADVEVGQKDMVTAIANDSTDLCAANGTDSNGNPTYPGLCGKTLSLPRFALSDGTRLYIADGGNDRVLVYNTIPTANAAEPDAVLGEPDEFSDLVTSSNTQFGGVDLTTSAADSTPTPTSLAWDGTNLYVTDPTNFRVLVFTPEQPAVAVNGVVNAFSQEIFAEDTIALGGTLNPGDTITLVITNGATLNPVTNTYVYTEKSGDTFDTILTALATMINSANSGAGDPNVIAQPELGFQTLNLVARAGGVAGNNVTVSDSLSDSAQITVTPASANLLGGETASTLAPGTLIQITGADIADQTVSTPPNIQALPLDLGGVEVYVDGLRIPLVSVAAATASAPATVIGQLPWELVDTNSSSLYVRTVHGDGSVTVTDAIGIPVTAANPGISAIPGPDPRVAMAFHSSSFATGTITVDGGVNGGDTATVGIEDRVYNYVVESTDTLASIRDAIIDLINSNSEEKVIASAAPAFTSIQLRAKVPGPQGNGIAISATDTGPTSGSIGSVTMTATNTALCCANIANAPITATNPALPGETIYVFATGLGLVGPNAARTAINDGSAYEGPAVNNPLDTISGLTQGVSVTVISAGLQVGGIGVYKLVIELSNELVTNPLTQLTVAQDVFTSNVVTIPVLSPNPNQ